MVLGLLVAALAFKTADAQSPSRRGFWLAAAFGGGYTTADCDQCDVESRETGSYLALALGGTVSRRVLVGAELNSWYRAIEDGDESLLGLFTVVQWYPWSARGLHLRTGVGWSYARSGYRLDDKTGKASKLGLGLRFGAGWDIRIRPTVSISPFLGAHIAALGDTEVRGTTLRNLLTTSRQVGVGVTVH